MSEIEVVDLISDEEAEGKEKAVGGMGGWFNAGEFMSSSNMDGSPKITNQRWKDYLEAFQPRVHPYLEALRRWALKYRVRKGGDWHQHSDAGTPVFSDGKIASYSYRGWGDLMAAIWSEEENVNYAYIDFYMGGYRGIDDKPVVMEESE